MTTNTIRIGTDLGGARSAGGGWLATLKARLGAVARMRQRRRAILELSRMSDARLLDMGVPRDAIPEVVDGLIARQGPGAAG